jgi:hypothetical protein
VAAEYRARRFALRQRQLVTIEREPRFTGRKVQRAAKRSVIGGYAGF